MLLIVASKEAFVAALGGPDAPAGTTGLTVGELADRLEQALNSLTSPGYRVYWPPSNRERFWQSLMGEQ